MPEIDIKKTIKEKRERLQMTAKELADAIGLPQNGDKIIRKWEKGEEKPSDEQLTRIIEFPEKAPFPNNENAKYCMIDLFAGIGGTRLGFCEPSTPKSQATIDVASFSARENARAFCFKQLMNI